ncbi:unnamed protein product [Bursaphelenchus okinawaensis]|uniref:EB domain-containing protein n=1 Tax=Bursaphelenchus okinawaensis TaxID=465554 RepID=A0A811LTR1_9BILA|nr:unnamed protein product [Bursaphelenchus okinawaensis]CAG9127752.1 unnamed protein product [Bursaphelenchus okinawaensis]
MRVWLLLHGVAALCTIGHSAIFNKLSHAKSTTISPKSTKSLSTNTIKLGQLCMTVEHFRAFPNDTQSFYECAPLAEEERKEYDIQGKYLGIWTKRKCSAEHAFDAGKQKCVDKKKLHRHRAQCQLNPGTTGCQQYCQPTEWAQPQVGAACNWQYSLLYYTPEDTHGFLQCAQTSASDPCGEWIRIDCPINTAFDINIQLCIPLVFEVDTCSAANQVAVCKCGTNSHTCPGISQCTNNVCCATVNPYDLLSYDNPSSYQASTSVCAGSGTYPVSMCNPSCPPTYTCQPNVGCCPVISVVPAAPTPAPTPAPVAQTPQTIVLQLTSCPASNSQPVSSCGSCPTGYICAPLLGACCPAPAPTTAPAPPPPPPPPPSQPIVMLCSNGQMPTSTCAPSSPCPSGSSCTNGVCCPCQCPPNTMMLGICLPAAPAPSAPTQAPAPAPSPCSSSGAMCYNGCCCSAPPKMPVCSNGQMSAQSCASTAQCGSGMECSNGGCCPIPYCPTGQQAIGRCSQGQTCGGGNTICLEGLCCTLPTCSSGQPAQSICTATTQCPPQTVCQNGGCCALPMCPTGTPASSTCSSSCSQPQPIIISIPAIASPAPAPPMPSPQPVTSCCSAGQQCVNGGCCTLPTCSTSSQPAIMLCTATTPCPSGTECSGRGCCPLPLCPSGQQAQQRCSVSTPCPVGTTCTSGLCCTLPVCTYGGQVASSFCGTSNACPTNYYCERGACCPEPIPLCPSGGRSVMQCVRGSDCPTGYGCTASGGCCQLVNDFICPINALPVCQCSPTMSCPVGSACNSGMCCTTSPSVAMAAPGTGCQASQQCSGYSSSGPGALCQGDICVCIKGAFSNGAACKSESPLVINIARGGCDQYGSPCKYMLSSARRRPVFSPTKNATDTPLWYNTAAATIRRCPRSSPDNSTSPDNTCLPNETCVKGECKVRLWPGEYGCDSNEECMSRCSNTYCEHKTDKGVSQCQCSNGLLLYGRCFEVCPKGFHESGAVCEHDDEDAFWASPAAQNALQKLLNTGSC